MKKGLRCKKCDYWIGESIVEMTVVAHVKRSEKVRLAPPRDLRVCGGCGAVNVLVPTSDIDKLRETIVA